MKFKKFIIVFLILAMAIGVAYAKGLFDRDDQDIYGNWKFHNLVTFDQPSIITGANIVNVSRYIQLPLASFLTSDAANGEQITTTTAPGFEIDDLIPGMVWADGEVTPAYMTFRVPDDYASGGAFKVLATESDSTTPNQVDFSVYLNSDGTAADSAATDQTPVALTGTTSTPSEITLTVATDFASLAAGDWVTLNIWRDNTADGTGDLEVKGVVFDYTATQ